MIVARVDVRPKRRWAEPVPLGSTALRRDRSNSRAASRVSRLSEERRSQSRAGAISHARVRKKEPGRPHDDLAYRRRNPAFASVRVGFAEPRTLSRASRLRAKRASQSHVGASRTRSAARARAARKVRELRVDRIQRAPRGNERGDGSRQRPTPFLTIELTDPLHPQKL